MWSRLLRSALESARTGSRCLLLSGGFIIEPQDVGDERLWRILLNDDDPLRVGGEAEGGEGGGGGRAGVIRGVAFDERKYKKKNKRGDEYLK